MARYKKSIITVGMFAGVNTQEATWIIEYLKDFNARRAAEVACYSPDSGYMIRDKPHVQEVMNRVLAARLEISDIDAEWALMEAVDNVQIAKQQGNISASNTALGLVFKHKNVDAMAADKVHVSSSQEIAERLNRARDRLQEPADEVSFL